MNEQPKPQFQSLGAPPTATALGRVMPYFRGMVAGGALVGGTVFVATLLLPDGFRPGDVAGKVAGGTLAHEIRESVDSVIDRDRRSADAQAQAHAKAQVDAAIVTTAMAQQATNLGGQGGSAVLADVACNAGKMLAANTQPSLGTNWRPDPYSWNGIGQTVARAACGLGDTLRQEVQRSIVGAAQAAAAQRGMALTDGSVSAHPQQRVAQAQTAPATPSGTKPTVIDLLRVMSIGQASRHYDAGMVADAEKVATSVPQEIRARLRDGPAATDDDVFVERVMGLLRIVKALHD